MGTWQQPKHKSIHEMKLLPAVVKLDCERDYIRIDLTTGTWKARVEKEKNYKEAP